MSLPVDPARRLGVFKRYADVPARYRLDPHAGKYRDRDVFGEYDAATGALTSANERHQADLRRAVEWWSAFMDERDRHPALATPTDAEAWLTDLLADRTPLSVYNPYFTTLEQFYEWMRTHTEHPHVVNPFTMAAAEFPAPDGAAGRVWGAKIAERTRSGGDGENQ